MKNVTPPRVVSFETALQNLAAKLTGQAAADLPKTQEALVQYIAENIPSIEELAEAITQEVLERLPKTASEELPPAAPAAPAEPPAQEEPTAAPAEPPAQEEPTAAPAEPKTASEGGQETADTPKPQRSTKPKTSE